MNRKPVPPVAALCCFLALAACSNPGGGGPLEVTVTYDRNGAGSGAVPRDATAYKPADEVTVAGNTGSLAKAGFVYAGWNTMPDRSGDAYVEGDRFAIGSTDVTLYAAWDEVIPGFSYTTSGGKVTITKYTGSEADLIIPATINGLPVTAIGGRAFESCTALVSVTIPSSVTTVGEVAFGNCTGLVSVAIAAPSGLTAIGSNAFEGCTSLGSMTIPASVTSMGQSVFYECTKLASVTFSAPSGLTSIAQYTFKGCSSLASVDLPDSVTSIGYQAFFYCENLASVTMPGSLTTVGEYAFSGCKSLASLALPASVAFLGECAFYGCAKLVALSFAAPSSLARIGDYAFCLCTGLASVTIPDSVTFIGEGSFYKCTKLTPVTIPPSVTFIGKYAFYECTSLVAVHVGRFVSGGSPEITELGSGSDVFGNNAAGRIIYVPMAAVDLYKAAANWSTYESALPGSIQGE